MAPTKPLRSLTAEELDDLAMRATAERAEAEVSHKERQLLIQGEVDRRAHAAAVAAVPPEIRAAILAQAGAQPPAADEG